ncbi:MAG: thioredoxin [Flavobacteriaceae bacterium]|nr:thioredoxin [Flavobacteriaceae bacterium]
MKEWIYTCFCLTALLSQGCGQKTTSHSELKPLDALQIINEDNDTILVGQINRKNLELNPTYNQWYQNSYEKYRIPENWIDQHKTYVQNLTAKIFMGTWCIDTHRELGSMIKILDSLEISHDKIEMYALTEDKDSPDGMELNYNIQKVPTLILFESGIELNRIVEFPIQSLHQDLSKILKKESYQDAYYDF